MSYLPRMIYKDGKLSNDPSTYKIVKNIKELLDEANNGFFPIGCPSTSKLTEIPEVHAEINGLVDVKVRETRSNKIIEDALKEKQKENEIKAAIENDKKEKEEKEKADIEKQLKVEKEKLEDIKKEEIPNKHAAKRRKQ